MKEVKASVEAALKQYQALGASLVDEFDQTWNHPCHLLFARPSRSFINLSRYDGVRYGYRCDSPKTWKIYHPLTFGRALVPRYSAVFWWVPTHWSAGCFDAYYVKAQKSAPASSARLADKAFELWWSLPNCANDGFIKSVQALALPKFIWDVYTIGCELGGLTFIKPSGGFWWWQSACRLTADCKGMGWRDATANCRCVSTSHLIFTNNYHPSPKPKEPCYENENKPQSAFGGWLWSDLSVSKSTASLIPTPKFSHRLPPYLGRAQHQNQYCWPSHAGNFSPVSNKDVVEKRWCLGSVNAEIGMMNAFDRKKIILSRFAKKATKSAKWRTDCRYRLYRHRGQWRWKNEYPKRIHITRAPC